MGDELRREETQAVPSEERRATRLAEHCTLCGSLRIRTERNGTVRYGACGLVSGGDGTGGCKDPTFDVDVEAARSALHRLFNWAISGSEPNERGEAQIEADRDAIAKMIGVGGPRRRP